MTPTAPAAPGGAAPLGRTWRRSNELGWVGMGAVVFLLAALMTPSDAMLTLFGWEVPVTCTLRRLTGLECPACGLTRSFVYLAHGAPLAAWRMNALGPALFAAMAFRAGLGAWRLSRPAR